MKKLHNFSQNGTVGLFHYSLNYLGNEVVLDVNKFGKNYFTQREKKFASKQRLFFYLNPMEKELYFRRSSLYFANVAYSEIYDVTIDSCGILKKWSKINFNHLFSMVEDLGYKGIYTNGRGFHAVEWFEPIHVKKIQEETFLENLLYKV
jgi:hypothetical protein